MREDRIKARFGSIIYEVCGVIVVALQVPASLRFLTEAMAGRPQIPAGSLRPKTSGPHDKQYFVIIKYLSIKPVKLGIGQAYDVR